MKILKIRTGGKILRIKDCKGLSSVRGLMFDSLEDKDGALIHANSIWVPFCKPLDLFFLDKNFEVLEKREAITLTVNPKTWKSYNCRKAKYCLELRRGLPAIPRGRKVRFS